MNDISYLDKIRLNDGIEKCQDALKNMLIKNSFTAIDYLNDRRLTFACLYILMPIIKATNIKLNKRNMEAIKFVDYIKTLTDKPLVESYDTLKWMLETGFKNDGLNEEYEEVLELVISVLIDTYKDSSILPIVSDMIFHRHKKGRAIHDLVWAYFKIKNPKALRFVAERLKSPDNDESSLACNLLGISEDNKDHDFYIKWLRDNDPFLYFTEDSFQYSSNPKVYKIDLERKYINKGTASYEKTPIEPENDYEVKCLEVFKSLSNEDKNILSEYSHKKHVENKEAWEAWIQTPINQQIDEARRVFDDFSSKTFL